MLAVIKMVRNVMLLISSMSHEIPTLNTAAQQFDGDGMRDYACQDSDVRIRTELFFGRCPKISTTVCVFLVGERGMNSASIIHAYPLSHGRDRICKTSDNQTTATEHAA